VLGHEFRRDERFSDFYNFFAFRDLVQRDKCCIYRHLPRRKSPKGVIICNSCCRRDLGNKIETFCAIVEELFIVGGGLLVVRGSLPAAFNGNRNSFRIRAAEGAESAKTRLKLDSVVAIEAIWAARNPENQFGCAVCCAMLRKPHPDRKPMSFLNTIYIMYGFCLYRQVQSPASQ